MVGKSYFWIKEYSPCVGTAIFVHIARVANFPATGCFNHVLLCSVGNFDLKEGALKTIDLKIVLGMKEIEDRI